MTRQSIVKLTAATALITLMAGCSTWDGMSSRQKGATAGAGAGGVVMRNHKKSARY